MTTAEEKELLIEKIKTADNWLCFIDNKTEGCTTSMQGEPLFLIGMAHHLKMYAEMHHKKFFDGQTIVTSSNKNSDKE